MSADEHNNNTFLNSWGGGGGGLTYVYAESSLLSRGPYDASTVKHLI